MLGLSSASLTRITEPRVHFLGFLVDQPRNGEHFALDGYGDVAAPIFAQVTGGALRTLGVAPDAPLKPLQVARQGVATPAVVREAM